jgi:hypothetical protein
VEARADSLLVFCDLESAAGFETNRTGLVVLHPYQVAGRELTVSHASDGAEATHFPQAISPHQPVSDIATLAWQDDGLAIDVRFEGDVFEMEDQRNWSDASFKTYSRPLALPFPYRVARGERVRQGVTIRVRESAPAATAASTPADRPPPRGSLSSDPRRGLDGPRSGAPTGPCRRRCRGGARPGFHELAGGAASARGRADSRWMCERPSGPTKASRRRSSSPTRCARSLSCASPHSTLGCT